MGGFQKHKLFGENIHLLHLHILLFKEYFVPILFIYSKNSILDFYREVGEAKEMLAAEARRDFTFPNTALGPTWFPSFQISSSQTHVL